MNTNRPLLRIGIAATLFVVCLSFYGSAWSADSPTDRVLQFITNAHTGVPMQASEWLSDETQSSKVFKGHGGIERVVQQTTALAHRFGGLRSVRVVKVTKKDTQALVEVEVTFFDEAGRRKSPSAAERDSMKWEVRTTKVGSKWVLSL